MRRNVPFHLGLAAAIGLSGCSASETTNSDTSIGPDGSGGSGLASLTIRLGPVGVLARGARMDPARLVLRLRSPGAPTILDTVHLAGNGPVSRVYSLPSQRNWILEATGLDQRDSVLYAGTSSFAVFAQDTTKVDLALDARYSSLRVRLPVLDSMTRFVFSVDGRIWGDSSVAKQSRVGDTIEFAHDYLSATPTGVSHAFSVRIYGQPWNVDTLLYSLDTSLRVTSGSDLGRNFTLLWVGPRTPPPGLASLSISLGSVGALDIGVTYPGVSGLSFPWNPFIEYGTLVDPRDGNTYKTATIGAQTWMAEDLRFTGNTCPSGLFCAVSGPYYDWRQAIGWSSTSVTGALCPAGWTVPSVEDWNQLIAFSGGPDKAGRNLRAGGSWNGSSGTDAFGFHAVPSPSDGGRISWWTRSNADPSSLRYGWSIDMGLDSVQSRSTMYIAHYPVRCVKN